MRNPRADNAAASCGLYAGRRRFMTQYVAKFPLPELARSRKLVAEVSKILKAGQAAVAAERKVNCLVWEAFGIIEIRSRPC